LHAVLHTGVRTHERGVKDPAVPIVTLRDHADEPTRGDSRGSPRGGAIGQCRPGMRLRAQLLVVALLAAALPVSGWHAVRELDISLRATRVQAQQLALTRLELALVRERALAAIEPGTGAVPGSGEELHAERAVAPIEIDGYADDWRELGAAVLHVEDDRGGISVRAAEREGRLHLLIDLPDATPVYHQPPRLVPDAGENESPDALSRIASGDALQLLLLAGDVRQHALLSPIAPGGLAVLAASPGAPGTGVRTGTALRGWRAAWTDRPGGYRVELSLPLPPAARAGVRLGIAAIDVPAPGAPGRTRASVSPWTMGRLHRRPDPVADARVPRLHRTRPALERVLRERVPAGARVRVFDAAGWLLADIDRLNGVHAAGPVPAGEDADDSGPAAERRVGDALLVRVLAFLNAGDLPLSEPTRAGRRGDGRASSGIDPDDPGLRKLIGTGRYVTPELDRVMGTFRPVGATSPGAAPAAGTASRNLPAWLWYETNEEHSATHAGNRLPRAFAVLFLAGIVASALPFAWACRLALRIRHLSRATARAVAHGGRVRADGLPCARATDEVGELSRDLERLLKRSTSR